MDGYNCAQRLWRIEKEGKGIWDDRNWSQIQESEATMTQESKGAD